MLDLRGRTALVTGASRRLGRAISLRLAGRGCNIVIQYRSSAAEAGKVAAEVEKAGAGAWSVRSTLGSREECEELIRSASELSGGVHFLINNASVFPAGDIATAGREDFEEPMLVNAFAPYWLTASFSSTDEAISVVNMLDTRVSGYDFSNFPYYASKRLLADITANQALRYAPSLRVNAVAPGLILAPEGKGGEYLKRVAKVVPMLRHGEAEDVAAAVEFLLSSDFITGQTIFVDGGQHLLPHIFGDNREKR